MNQGPSSEQNINNPKLLAAATAPAIERNPLLEFRVPFPFAQVRAEHIAPAAEKHLAQAQAELEAVLNVTGPRTLENTLYPFDRIAVGLSRFAGIVGSHLMSVCMDKSDIEEEWKKVRDEISAFSAKLGQNTELYNALRELKESGSPLITFAESRFLTNVIADFERSGVALATERKEQLVAILTEESRLREQFRKNVTSARGNWKLFIDKDSDKLRGLPAEFLARVTASAEKNGRPGSVLIQLDDASLGTVMQFADDPTLRREVYEAYFSVAGAGQFDNNPNLLKQLTLRDEKSKILGRKSFAELQLEDKMVSNPEMLKAFLDKFRDTILPYALKEQKELINFKRECTGDPTAEIEPWDSAYYVRKLEERDFSINAEVIREHLPLERVEQSLFDLARIHHGLEFRLIEGASSWHEDARHFEVFNASGELIAHVGLDLFARPGQKRSGAWQASLLPMLEGYSEAEIGFYVVVANFAPPAPNSPALLSPDQATTLFHEFGHLLHSLNIRVPFFGQQTVPWDFVETPSQMNEGFFWETGAISEIAKHWKTGAELGGDVIDRLVASRSHFRASQFLRQYAQSTLDLLLHTDFDPNTHGSAKDYARAFLEQYSVSKFPSSYDFPSNFLHIFAHTLYPVGYYGYLWARVLAADGFMRMQELGLRSPEAGAAWRENVLRHGDSEAALSCMNRFLGRSEDALPDIEALLRFEGIKTK